MRLQRLARRGGRLDLTGYVAWELLPCCSHVPKLFFTSSWMTNQGSLPKSLHCFDAVTLQRWLPADGPLLSNSSKSAGKHPRNCWKHTLPLMFHQLPGGAVGSTRCVPNAAARSTGSAPTAHGSRSPARSDASDRVYVFLSTFPAPLFPERQQPVMAEPIYRRSCRR